MRPDFDALYHRTLTTSQGLPHFCDIVSIVALTEAPLSITQISELLDIETFYVSNVLVNLHSIMQIPGDDRSPVTLWHTSLRDFLTSEERAGPFFAHPAYHLRIAFRCASLSNGRSTGSSQTSWLEFSKNFAKEHLIKSAGSVEGTECTFNSGVLASVTESLNKPWFDGRTALEVACRAKHWKLVRALVNAGADPSTRFQGSEDHIVVPLHAACHYKAREVIALLLDKGADLNVVAPLSNYAASWGWYGFPLAWATSEGDIGLVDRLLAHGADPNLEGGWYGSALHISAKSGEYDIVRMLLGHGADPDVKDRAGRTPLHTVARRGHVNVAECLLEFGADTNIQDKGGETPLHRASVWGTAEVGKLLLNHNADPSIRSNKGRTALQRAHDANERGVVEMLLEWGITG